MERIAFIDDYACLHHQPGNQPVPHHPAAGGKIKNPVPVGNITMQAMFLDMLHQRAAGRMDNAFWRACCPGAIQDIKRIIKANAAKILYRGMAQAIGKQSAVRYGSDIRPGIKIGIYQHIFH